MSELNIELCPNCFEKVDKGSAKCPHCGGSYEVKSSNAHALKPMSVVAERYVIGKVLGAGGFGVTYKAKDLLTDEICAIKEYFPTSWAYRANDGQTLVAKSEKEKYSFSYGKKRFLDEAKMLIKFEKNENIVHVKNFFASNNTAYLVMEYLDGINFRTMMNKRGGKLPFAACVQVFTAVANALQTIHAMDILHRDISPENIFITRESKIILIDFGSARQYVNEDTDLSVFIKPGLAPIEQYYSNGKQGPWTDIYALASTFYQSVSGIAVPLAPDRIMEDSLKPLDSVCPSVPAGWSRVIEKALRVNASERYQTIDELLDDVNKITTISSRVAPPPPPAQVKPVLIIEQCKHSNEWSGNRIELQKDREYSLGRSVQKCDIIVDMAEYVSRRHCSLIYDSAKKSFLVKDVSANGTFKESGERISREGFEQVMPGTRLFLGSRSTVIRVATENE